jgi:TonB family protein
MRRHLLVRSGLLLLSILGAACGGAGGASKPTGGTAAGTCREVEHGAFPGVQSGDKPTLPKSIEEREVAAGHKLLKLAIKVCVGPSGNVISADVSEPSQSTDLDAHVKQTVEGWTFCPFTPDREESQPRCDTLRFQFEIKPGGPASAPATPATPATPTTPPAPAPGKP